MTKPWLTVVMPVHRGGDWLDEALASIPAADEAGSIAVIIRDSTPEGPCEAPIARHRDRLDIDYEYWPEMPSWPGKTNAGVEAAQSEHVCTLHQDDIWLPGRAELIRSMIAEHPDAALYLTGAQIIDGHGETLGQWQPPFPRGEQDRSTYLDRLLVQNSIAMPSPVWRRDAYLAAGGMDDSLWYATDWDLWLKLSEQGPVVFEPQASAAFRIHANSLTMTGDKVEMERELEQILTRYASADRELEPLSRASVSINTALAQASTGEGSALWPAVKALTKLGPLGAVRYLRYSRLIERLLPRLRLRLKGAM